jgi:Leucine-rich repeat (LRR) protein
MNELTSLPPALGLLTNLKRLYVRHSRRRILI